MWQSTVYSILLRTTASSISAFCFDHRVCFDFSKLLDKLLDKKGSLLSMKDKIYST